VKNRQFLQPAAGLRREKELGEGIVDPTGLELVKNGHVWKHEIVYRNGTWGTCFLYHNSSLSIPEDPLEFIS
jgi:hypothetical protein